MFCVFPLTVYNVKKRIWANRHVRSFLQSFLPSSWVLTTVEKVRHIYRAKGETLTKAHAPIGIITSYTHDQSVNALRYRELIAQLLDSCAPCVSKLLFDFLFCVKTSMFFV